MKKPRSDFENTPEGRIAAAADSIVRRIRSEYERQSPGALAAGNRIYPDIADFREGLSLYVKREILLIEIRVIQRYGTFAEALRRTAELDRVRAEIARREGAT